MRISQSLTLTHPPRPRPQITITAEKGRLSAEEIERMVKEAEEFADSDKAVKDKVDARNGEGRGPGLVGVSLCAASTAAGSSARLHTTPPYSPPPPPQASSPTPTT